MSDFKAMIRPSEDTVFPGGCQSVKVFMRDGQMLDKPEIVEVTVVKPKTIYDTHRYQRPKKMGVK